MKILDWIKAHPQRSLAIAGSAASSTLAGIPGLAALVGAKTVAAAWLVTNVITGVLATIKSQVKDVPENENMVD